VRVDSDQTRFQNAIKMVNAVFINHISVSLPMIEGYSQIFHSFPYREALLIYQANIKVKHHRGTMMNIRRKSPGRNNNSSRWTSI